MYRFFIQAEQVTMNPSDGDGTKEGTVGTLYIDGEDVNHIRNVLRMHPGEIIDCVDEDRMAYRCRIREYEEDRVICDILEKHAPETELENPITLYMGLPKSDKPELVIQKAVELGAVRIVPMITRRTVVRVDEKRAEKKHERWQAVAESAAKQSKRAMIPEVGPIISYSEALKDAAKNEVNLIPYEQERDIAKTREIIRGIRPGQSVGVFVGPEGGFEEQEIEDAKKIGVRPVTLGRRILRAETACITILSILMYELDR